MMPKPNTTAERPSVGPMRIAPPMPYRAIHDQAADAASRLAGIRHHRPRSWPSVNNSAEAWLPGYATRSPGCQLLMFEPTVTILPAALYPGRKGNFQSVIFGSLSHWCVPVHTANSVPALTAL